MLRTKGERQLLADVAAGLVDDRQAIGIGVLGEGNIRAETLDQLGQAFQIGLRGLGKCSY